MSKLKFFAKITLLMIIALWLAGCSDQANIITFEGVNITFEYDQNSWEISQTRTESNHVMVIMKHIKSEKMLAIMGLEGESIDSDQFFQFVREQDNQMDLIREVDTKDEKEGYSISSLEYYHKQSMQYFQVHNFNESNSILTAAEWDGETLDEQIVHILSTLSFSEKQETGIAVQNLNAEAMPTTLLSKYADFYYESDQLLAMNDAVVMVDKSFRDVEGYEYLKETEMTGYDKIVRKVLFPATADHQGNELTFEGHGVEMQLRVGRLKDANLSGYLDLQQQEYDTYQDVVKLEENETAEYLYQVIQYSTDQQDKLPVISISYVKKFEEQEVLELQIQLQQEQFDGETNKILKEISAAYEIMVEQYGVDPNQLTLGGQLIDDEQGIYQYDGVQTEIIKREEYSWIGTSTLSKDQYQADISVPLGRETNHWGERIDFDLYGITGETVITLNHQNLPYDSYAVTMLSYEQEYQRGRLSENSVLSEIAAAAGTLPEVFGAYYVEQVSLADNTQYPIYHVLVSRQLGDGYLEQITLKIDRYYSSTETTEILNEYGQVLGFDFMPLLQEQQIEQ